MQLPILYKPTHRNTKCYIVEIDDVKLCFSYETLIGIRSPRVVARLPIDWGPTTGRHFIECQLPSEAIVDHDTFQEIVNKEIYGLVPRLTRRKFKDARIAA